MYDDDDSDDDSNNNTNTNILILMHITTTTTTTTIIAYEQKSNIIPIKEIDLDKAIAGDTGAEIYDQNLINHKTQSTSTIGNGYEYTVLLKEHEKTFDSNCVWTVESADITKGGAIEWRTDFIR